MTLSQFRSGFKRLISQNGYRSSFYIPVGSLQAGGGIRVMKKRGGLNFVVLFGQKGKGDRISAPRLKLLPLKSPCSDRGRSRRAHLGPDIVAASNLERIKV